VGKLGIQLPEDAEAELPLALDRDDSSVGMAWFT
jgi:hypothetical protein